MTPMTFFSLIYCALFCSNNNTIALMGFRRKKSAISVQGTDLRGRASRAGCGRHRAGSRRAGPSATE